MDSNSDEEVPRNRARESNVQRLIRLYGLNKQDSAGDYETADEGAAQEGNDDREDDENEGENEIEELANDEVKSEQEDNEENDNSEDPLQKHRLFMKHLKRDILKFRRNKPGDSDDETSEKSNNEDESEKSKQSDKDHETPENVVDQEDLDLNIGENEEVIESNEENNSIRSNSVSADDVYANVDQVENQEEEHIDELDNDGDTKDSDNEQKMSDEDESQQNTFEFCRNYRSHSTVEAVDIDESHDADNEMESGAEESQSDAEEVQEEDAQNGDETQSNAEDEKEPQVVLRRSHIQEDDENRQTDEELKTTDDESLSAVDAFNLNYRYVFRYSKSNRRSQSSQQEEALENDAEDIPTNDNDNTETTIQDTESQEVEYRNPIYNEHPEVLVSDSGLYIENVEELYAFHFNDPSDVLSTIKKTQSQRLSTNSSNIDVDGIMKTPQQVYEQKLEEEEKIYDEKFETEQNREATDDNININTRALTKEAKTYELENFEKNALMIFNQEKIYGYKPRTGTRQDVEALTNTFSAYGFEVVEHLDYTRDRIFAELEQFSKRDFTDYGCVAVAILTHGSDEGSLRAKDRTYNETDIINYFKTSNNVTLVTKPRVIIIQACRGKESTFAVPVGIAAKVRKDHDDPARRSKVYTLPVESDLLVVHSTFAGKTSYRDELLGTWFIQTLCQKINNLSTTHDLESIITEVKREVAIEKSFEEFNRRTEEFDINKQMPVVISTLIRKLYLRGHQEISSNMIGVDFAEPVTPSVRYVPCACFLDRFEYLKTCMRHFLEENDEDATGRSFLQVAEAMNDGVEFYAAKEQISKAISNHLMERAKDCDYYKYLYFCKD